LEDRVIERREERHDVASHPRHQFCPEQPCLRATPGARSKARPRRRRDSLIATASRYAARCPQPRALTPSFAFELSAAPDDVSYSRRRTAVISPNLGDCFTAGIPGQNLRPLAARDLSLCSRIRHSFSHLLFMHL